MTGNEETKAKIEKAALDEFMEKGFANASLRQIVKNAGLTTGAFYKYFPTKEDLFASLVEPYANKIYSIYDVTLQNFQTLSSSEQQNAMTRVSTDSITQMLNYIYEHYDILNCCFVRLTARSLLLLYIILLKEKRSQPLNLLKICEKAERKFRSLTRTLFIWCRAVCFRQCLKLWFTI